MAVGAQDADVIGRIVLPVSVDMLDFKRHAARKRIAFIPTATLALLADCLDDVTSYRSVEVQPRR
jgi:hypothetical protein